MVTAGENQEPWQCDLGPRLTSIFFKTSFQTIAGAGYWLMLHDTGQMVEGLGEGWGGEAFEPGVLSAEVAFNLRPE